MILQPRRPPGRVNRKAAAYAHEVIQLRQAGYTFEAIREAFADIGIALSASALQREVRRHRLHPPPSATTPAKTTAPRAGAQAPALPSSAHRAPAPMQPSPNASPAATGREVAEAFFNAHRGHALLRNQEPS